MSTIRRRNTVHDLAALRLHPDGTRVQENGAKAQLGHAPYIAKDFRGRLIAVDAGGSGKVPRRVIRKKLSEDQEIDEALAQDDVVSSSVKSKGKQKEILGGAAEVRESDTISEPDLRDARAIKRRKFIDDFDFLSQPSSPSHSPEGSVPPSLSQPSSELLKYVHYFASTYYTQHEQLIDSSKEARRLGKVRRLQRIRLKAEEEKTQRRKERVKSHEGDTDQSEEDVTSSEDEGEEPESNDANDADSKKDAKNDNQHQSREKPKNLTRDMYKMMDGSALMAIGILLQEHISHLLSHQIPEPWEDEIMEVLSDAEKASNGED